MSLSRSLHWLRMTGFSLAMMSLAACTVEPLNASRPEGQLARGTVSEDIRQLLASTDVSPAKTRVAQQVRNNLLFAMNGGTLQPGGRYRIDLKVTNTVQDQIIQSNTLTPVASQLVVRGDYTLIDTTNGKAVASGRRQAIAPFDQTPQSFANQRAERDAENRAAADLAQQIRLSVAQSLATL